MTTLFVVLRGVVRASSFVAALALLVIGLGISQTAAADPRINCVARVLAGPDFKDFKADVVALLGPSSNLLADATATGVLDEELKRFLTAKMEFRNQPKDVFCVLGEDVKNLDAVPVDAGGGQFFVFASPGFQLHQMQSDRYSIVPKSGGGVGRRSVLDLVENRLINDVLRPLAENCSPDPLDHEGSACWANYDDQLAYLTDRYAADIAKYQYAGDQLQLFDAGPGTAGIQLNAFVFASTVHEFLAEPAYVALNAKPQLVDLRNDIIDIWNDALGVANVFTVRQWLSGMSVELMRNASYGVAIELVDMLRDAPPELQRLRSVRPLSLYAAVVPVAAQTSLESAFARFLCETKYASALGDLGLAQDLYKLATYQDMLCGSLTLDRTILFSADRVAGTNFDDLITALEAMQEDINHGELLEAVKQLQLIALDQTLLLNDLKSFAATDTFERKLSELGERIAALEAKSTEKGFVSVLQAVGDLASGGSGLIGGGGKLLDLWDQMPGSLKGAIDFIKDNNDKFQEAGKDLSDGVKNLGTALDVLETLFDDYEDDLGELKAQKEAVQAKFEEVLAEIAALRSRYYSKIDAAVAEAQRLSLSNSVQTAKVATNLADIVGFVALANAGTRNPSNNLAICKKALELGFVDTSKGYIAEIISACLKISNQVEATQKCVSGGGGLTPSRVVTTVRSVDQHGGIRLAFEDQIACFSEVR